MVSHLEHAKQIWLRLESGLLSTLPEQSPILLLLSFLAYVRQSFATRFAKSLHGTFLARVAETVKQSYEALLTLPLGTQVGGTVDLFEESLELIDVVPVFLADHRGVVIGIRVVCVAIRECIDV